MHILCSGFAFQIGSNSQMPDWIGISEACFFCICREHVLVWKAPSILEQKITDNVMGLLLTGLLIEDFFFL